MLEVLVLHCWASVLLEWLCCRTGRAVLVRSCTIPGLGMAATLCSGALSEFLGASSHLGSQQPVLGCAASGSGVCILCFLSVHPLVLECAASGRSCWGSPVRLFHQMCWSFALPAVLPVPRVVVDGSFMGIPVNLVFLHGLGAQWGKFGFQTPAWFHSYPYDQQMELREYCFWGVKEIIFLQFLT